MSSQAIFVFVVVDENNTGLGQGRGTCRISAAFIGNLGTSRTADWRELMERTAGQVHDDGRCCQAIN